MNQGLWLNPKALVYAALLTVALAAAGCARQPRTLTAPADQPGHDRARTPEPGRGLSFRYQGAGDGANTNGPAPSTSWTEFEVSDGSEVRAYQHSFKRPEYAERFYTDRIGGAAAVLEEGAQDNGPDGVTGRRAVIEFSTRGEEPRGAILELRGSSVSEVIGATVGHALAFERWQKQERQ